METPVKTPNEFAPTILHFVMILKVGFPSLNAFFSGPKSQNDKVSVPIRKRITCRFQKSPYFYSQCHFYGSYDHLNKGLLFWDTLYILSFLLFILVLILPIGMVQLSSGVKSLLGWYIKVWDETTNTKIIQKITGMW